MEAKYLCRPLNSIHAAISCTYFRLVDAKMHGTRVICKSFETIQSVAIVFNARNKRLITLRFFNHFRSFCTPCRSSVFSPLTNFSHFQVFTQFLRSNAVFHQTRLRVWLTGSSTFRVVLTDGTCR